MKTYFAVFRMRLIVGMQYRAAAWAGILTQFFWGFMYIMIYMAFYASGGAKSSMPLSQLVSYIWLQQAFLNIIMMWLQDDDLLPIIANGHVAYELCRPYNLFKFWYARLLATRVSNTILRCLPVLLIASLLPTPYHLELPAGIDACALFLLSLCLSLFLVTAISMFIYILTFVTLSPVGPKVIVALTAEFLQGSMIPIPLMPTWLQQILNFLPFRYSADFHLEFTPETLQGQMRYFK